MTFLSLVRHETAIEIPNESDQKRAAWRGDLRGAM